MDDNTGNLQTNKALIKVYGVGGAGVNAVNNMITSGLSDVQFYAANTDAQSLQSSKAENKISLGEELTRNLGCGGDPDVGQSASRESSDAIRTALEGADMVFITCGMGGGTGTLGSAVAAEIARELGCLTVAVVTKPFTFEGKRRMRNAERGIEELKKHVDTLITIPNQRLLSISSRNTSILDTFKKADDVLFQAVRGISDLITREGYINVDFQDVRSVMSEMGLAMMGTGEASGENRAVEAAKKAVSSPLLEDISINGARGVLINITASSSATLDEIEQAASMVQEQAHDEANIIFGMVIDESLEDKFRITVIATGFEDPNATQVGLNTSTISSSFPGITSSFPGIKSPVKPVNPKLPIWMQENQKPQKTTNVVKADTVSVLGGKEKEKENDDKYEIPTFLRKQMD